MNTQYQYEDLLSRVLHDGVQKGDRTGTGTRSLFAQQLRYDLADGFPLITTKKIHFRSVVYELLWFLRGDTNIKYLQDNNVHIWDEWAGPDGELGPVYGNQWRHWGPDIYHQIDQISEVLHTLRTNPDDRRMIVTAWNPSDVQYQALPPCHILFQFYVANRRLSCHLYQRSCDLFLGVPFNIASYALLTRMVAQQVGLSPGELIWTGGDCHIYNNHVTQVTQQLSRPAYPFPTVMLSKPNSLFDYTYEHVTLLNYRHHPAISAPVAV